MIWIMEFCMKAGGHCISMYPGFAKIAREEGFNAVAVAFDAISISEKQHGKRYRDLAVNLEAEKSRGQTCQVDDFA